MNPAELLGVRQTPELAAARLASEKPGQTLDTAALVHEAFPELHNRHRQRLALGVPAAGRPGTSAGNSAGFGRSNASHAQPSQPRLIDQLKWLGQRGDRLAALRDVPFGDRAQPR